MLTTASSQISAASARFDDQQRVTVGITEPEHRPDPLVIKSAVVAPWVPLLKRLQGLGSAPAIDYDAYGKWIASRKAR